MKPQTLDPKPYNPMTLKLTPCRGSAAKSSTPVAQTNYIKPARKRTLTLKPYNISGSLIGYPTQKLSMYPTHIKRYVQISLSLYIYIYTYVYIYICVYTTLDHSRFLVQQVNPKLQPNF